MSTTLTPIAWTQQQLESLLVAADSLSGHYLVEGDSVPARLWWHAMIRAIWDTGLTRSELMRLRVEHVGDTTLAIARRYSPIHLLSIITYETSGAIEAICSGEREFVFATHSSLIPKHWARIIGTAGTDCARKAKGGAQ